MDFWPFFKLQKMEVGRKKFREIDVFDITSFFAWTFAMAAGEKQDREDFFYLLARFEKKDWKNISYQ